MQAALLALLPLLLSNLAIVTAASSSCDSTACAAEAATAEDALPHGEGLAEEPTKPRRAQTQAGRAPTSSDSIWQTVFPTCNWASQTYPSLSTTQHAAKFMYSGFWPEGSPMISEGFNSTADIPRVRIGAAVTMNESLPYGYMGDQYIKAYDLYLEMLMEEVGTLKIDGKEALMELVILDDFSDTGVTEEAYKVLTTCFSPLLLGPYSSTLSMNAASHAQSSGAVLVAPGSSNSQVFENNSRVFGILQNGGEIIPPALETLAARGAQTVVYVYEDKAGARGQCFSVDNSAPRYGLRLLAKQKITMTNLIPTLLQMKSLAPDIFIGCTYQSLCHQLIQEARRLKFDPKAFVMPICAPNPKFLEDTNYSGMYVMGIGHRMPDLPLAPGHRIITQDEIIDRWQSYHTVMDRPSYQALGAFSSIAALVLAIQYANSTDPDAVIAVLSNLTEVRFDRNRQRISTADVVQYAFTSHFPYNTVAPPDRADADPWYPRPIWDDMICYDIRQQSQYIHRGVALNSSDTQCQECPEGTVSKMTSVPRGIFSTTTNAVKTNMRVCQECSPGSEQRSVWLNSRVSEASCIACTPGLMGFNGSCVFCPAGKFQNLSAQTACLTCPAGRFSKSLASTECASCEIAADISGGIFYNTQEGSTECFACPSGGLCERQEDGLYSGISNKDKYYLLPSTEPGQKPKVYWCPHGSGKACMAHGRCYQDEQGEVAMEGPFCGKCREGFGRVNSWLGLCQKCDSIAMIVVSITFHMLLLLIAVLVLTYLAVTTDFSNPRQMRIIILRQFFNYLQMAQIVSLRLNATTENFLSDAFAGISSAFGQNGVGVYHVHCLVSMRMPDVHFFKAAQVYGLVLVPSVVMTFSAGFMILRWILGCFNVAKLRMSWLVVLVIISLYMGYSRVVQWLLVSVACHPFDVPRLVVDPSIKCGAHELMQWQAVAVCGCVIYMVGMPLLLSMVLFWFHRKGKLRSTKVLEMFGFLTSGFEPQYWYFEFVFMLRKLCFAMIPWLHGLTSKDPFRNNNIKNVMLVVVSGLFLTLQLCCQPFDKRGGCILDHIETTSLVAVSMTPLLSVIIWQDVRGVADGDASTANTEPWGGQVGYTISVVVITLLHLRVMLLFAWGLSKSWVIYHSRSLFNMHHTGWWSRLWGYFIPKGYAKLVEDGIEFQGISSNCESMFGQIIEDIVRLHIRESGTLTYIGLTHSLQHIMAEAQRLREEEENRKPSPVGYCLAWIKSKIKDPTAGGIIARIETALKNTGIRTSWHSASVVRPGTEGHAVIKQTTDGELLRAADASEAFSDARPDKREARISQARGQLFSIEEMQEALMRLSSANAYQQFYPVYEEDADAGGSHAMGRALGHVDTNRFESQSNMGAEEAEDLDLELEERKLEGVALKEALQKETEEHEQLQQQLQALEARLAEMGTPPPSDGEGTLEVEEDKHDSERMRAQVRLASVRMLPIDSPLPEPLQTPIPVGVDSDTESNASRPSERERIYLPIANQQTGEQDGSVVVPDDALDERAVAPVKTETKESSLRRKRMLEEKRALMLQRDEAVLSRERLELALSKAQLELRNLRGDIASEEQQAAETEAQLVLAEAENASLKRWAEATRKEEELREALLEQERRAAEEMCRSQLADGEAEILQERSAPTEARAMQEGVATRRQGEVRLRKDFLATCFSKEEPAEAPFEAGNPRDANPHLMI